jgi:hypothetical protein
MALRICIFLGCLYLQAGCLFHYSEVVEGPEQSVSPTSASEITAAEPVPLDLSLRRGAALHQEVIHGLHSFKAVSIQENAVLHLDVAYELPYARADGVYISLFFLSLGIIPYYDRPQASMTYFISDEAGNVVARYRYLIHWHRVAHITAIALYPINLLALDNVQITIPLGVRNTDNIVQTSTIQEFKADLRRDLSGAISPV